MCAARALSRIAAIRGAVSVCISNNTRTIIACTGSGNPSGAPARVRSASLDTDTYGTVQIAFSGSLRTEARPVPLAMAIILRVPVHRPSSTYCFEMGSGKQGHSDFFVAAAAAIATGGEGDGCGSGVTLARCCGEGGTCEVISCSFFLSFAEKPTPGQQTEQREKGMGQRMVRMLTKCSKEDKRGGEGESLLSLEKKTDASRERGVLKNTAVAHRR